MVDARFRWARQKGCAFEGGAAWLPAVSGPDGSIRLFCSSGGVLLLGASEVEWGGWFDADGSPTPLLDEHETNRLRSQVHVKDQRIRQLEEYVTDLSNRAQEQEQERKSLEVTTSVLDSWAEQLRVNSLDRVRRAVLLREPGGGADLEVAADLCSTSTKARAAVHLVLSVLEELNRSIAMDKAGV